MTVSFLLYTEDAHNKSGGKVELFLNGEAARSAMEAAYQETLRALRFDGGGRGGALYCTCKKSFAIIAGGESCYSWSIGQRKLPKAAPLFHSEEFSPLSVKKGLSPRH